ncbi:MAG: hypothetical protein KA314_29185 [Chloroflexi bacterium]|nr:hypothetical protein [Chloroflexota bacterium]MBP8059933.1 hypothetical protein [Chloroflexota bacterium]
MARKKDLASKLSTPATGEARPGWRDTITSGQPVAFGLTEPEPAQPESLLRRKTYLLTPDLIEQIEALADRERVGINELVRYLLGMALEQVDTGRLNVPTSPGKRRIVH